MKKLSDKNQDAALAQNVVTTIHDCMNAEVERLQVQANLRKWIAENTHGANDVAVLTTLLETALDRYIDLVGADRAFEVVEFFIRRSEAGQNVKTSRRPQH